MSTSPPSPDEILAIVEFTDLAERLYLRLEPVLAPTDGVVLSNAFRFRQPKDGEEPSGMSFNRSSMSTPSDVIAGKPPGWSVAGVIVGEVPSSTGSGQFTFKVEHKPLKGNRSHSEIRAYDEAAMFHAYPPTGVRKEFREAIARVAFPVPIDGNGSLG